MKSHNLWGGGSSFFRLKLYICVIFAIVAAAMILTSCKNTATEPDKPVKPAPIPKLANDTTLTFPTGKMEITQNGKKLEGTDGTNKTTVMLQAGTPSEITIKYNIDSGKTVYNVVATITEASAARSADSTTPVTHFVPYSAETTGVAYMVRGDTDFVITAIDEKPDEQFSNTNIFGRDYQTATQPYKVRVSFLGKQEYYFDAIYDWFSYGNSGRKNGGAIQKPDGNSNPKLHDFLANTKDLHQTEAYAPHAVVCNFGVSESDEDNFDSALFIQEYKALVSYLKSIKNTARTDLNFTTKIVLLSLPENTNGKNTGAVNNAIKKVATESGATFVDIAEIEKTSKTYHAKRTADEQSRGVNSTCSTANCKFHTPDAATNYAKRKVAEEVFLSFYLDIEEIATPYQAVSTTPKQKWGGTDNGNQDTTKRELIEAVKGKGDNSYPQVIFTGDSITDFFDGAAQKNQLRSQYNTEEHWKNNIGYNDNAELGSGTSEIYRALDLGNSGDFTQSLLYRWKKTDDGGSGAYDGTSAFADSVKAISLLIGTNNIAPNSISTTNTSYYQERPLSATETVRGQEEVIKVLKEKFPKAKIVLMAVYPRGDNNAKNQYIDFTRLQVMAINRLLRNKYGENGTAKDDRVIFVDTYEKYIKDCGCQHIQYFVGANDNIHLCPKGYQEIWWPTVEPILEKLCVTTITIPTPTGNILQNGIPVKLPEGCSARDVTCKVTAGSGGNVPFTAQWDASGNKIKITPNSSATGSGTVTLTAKNNSQITGSITINSEDYWRYYETSGTTYKFDLVKRFHFEGTAAQTGSGKLLSQSTTTANGYATVDWSEDSVLKFTGTGSTANGVNFWYTRGEKMSTDFDYVEFRFKDSGNSSVAYNTFKYSWVYSDGKFEVFEDGNLMKVPDLKNQNVINTTYNSSNTDWVTFGMWNDKTGDTALFVEHVGGNVIPHRVTGHNGTEDLADGSRTGGQSGDPVLELAVKPGAGATVTLDYVAFYKKVN